MDGDEVVGVRFGLRIDLDPAERHKRQANLIQESVGADKILETDLRERSRHEIGKFAARLGDRCDPADNRLAP